LNGFVGESVQGQGDEFDRALCALSTMAPRTPKFVAFLVFEYHRDRNIKYDYEQNRLADRCVWGRFG
jgi:hypothetical protein